METSRGKICPLMNMNAFSPQCIESQCAWWCGFAQDCSVPLLAGMFADSKSCNIEFGCNGIGRRTYRGEGEVER